MPSDWPHVFFGQPTANLPLYPAGTLPIAVPPKPAVQRAAPLQRSNGAHTLSTLEAQQVPASSKWPGVFFDQRGAAVQASTPLPLAPPQKPVQTARIPLPPRIDPAPGTDLPTINLPRRAGAPTLAAAASLQPTAAPASAPILPAIRLINGENISGTVLSEKPDAIFLQHEVLGVVTIPKNAIASRFVEILLHNGDTVAGEWIVDTAQFLVVRSALLGTLTVPRQAIRSIG